MSQENVDLARTANALFTAGDLDAALALYHPDIEFRDLQNAPICPKFSAVLIPSISC